MLYSVLMKARQRTLQLTNWRGHSLVRSHIVVRGLSVCSIVKCPRSSKVTPHSINTSNSRQYQHSNGCRHSAIARQRQIKSFLLWRWMQYENMENLGNHKLLYIWFVILFLHCVFMFLCCFFLSRAASPPPFRSAWPKTILFSSQVVCSAAQKFSFRPQIRSHPLFHVIYCSHRIDQRGRACASYFYSQNEIHYLWFTRNEFALASRDEIKIQT